MADKIDAEIHKQQSVFICIYPINRSRHTHQKTSPKKAMKRKIVGNGAQNVQRNVPTPENFISLFFITEKLE